MNVVVVGGGSWGTAFARLLADRGHEVTLACRDAEQAAAIRETGRNPRYLRERRPVAASTPRPSTTAPSRTRISSSSPCRARRSATSSRALPGRAPVLSLTKGLDPATGNRLSTLVRDRPVAVLSGPNIAEEIARGLPAAAVIACESLRARGPAPARDQLDAFRVYVNDDVVGVELCAAAKNVIALAAGGADGLGLGDNAKAALVARGLAEMGRLADVGGARPETFAGLAGMGDLIVTCWSPSGRNRRCGELIAQGATPEEAAREIGMVVEGLTTAPVLRDLAHRLDVELPIIEGVCAVLDGRSAERPRGSAMRREPTVE